MSRWPPDAAERLHDAAMELFAEQGFAATTVPEIAQRAGLTTRSFFRWYADKREVLFTGEDELPTVIEQIFEEAGPELGPMEIVRYGFRAVLGPRLERLRPELLARQAVVHTDAGLEERQLKKHVILLEAATRGFRGRGLAPIQAELAGRLAVVVYETAIEHWLSSSERSFDSIADEVLDVLPELTVTVG